MTKDLTTTMFYGCRITDEQWIKYAKNELKDEMKSECDYLNIDDDGHISEYLFQVLGTDGLSKKLGIKIIRAIDDETTYVEYYAVCGTPVVLVDFNGIKNRKLKEPSKDDISKYEDALLKIGIEYNDITNEIWGVSSFDC
jgi:hypothetical protein